MGAPGRPGRSPGRASPPTACILTAPMPLAGPVSSAHVAALVAADAFVRRRRHEGAVGWVPTSGWGLAVQHAVEQELRHEGLETSAVDAGELLARVRGVEDAGMSRLAGLAEQLGVGLHFGDAGEAAGRAARTAFVRLFDAGLVEVGEQVVDVCPHCSTVVDGADAVPVELDGEALVLRLACDGAVGEVHVRTLVPELLAGTVAVVVPEGHEAAGASALVPLAGGEVPVLADPSAAQPALVVPGHDAVSLDLARRWGLSPVRVVDDDATVRVPGPLDGLSRYAARSAARDLLAAEGAVVRTEAAPEPATQCRWCGTVIVARLGHHWLLATAELEVAAADAVREGRVDVWPAAARDELLARAGGGALWCVGRRLWSGEPVPMTRCVDCGQVDVAVEPRVSCGRCMGRARGNDEVLDARFVGWATPLAAAGWPDGRRRGAGTVGTTTAVVRPADLVEWALPALALGLWLTGEAPFDSVVVAPGPLTDDDPGDGCAEVAALVEAEGRRVARAVLLGDGLDVDAARRLVAALDAPPAAHADVDGGADPGADVNVEGVVEACAAALDAGAPGAVLRLVAAAVAAGLPPAAGGTVRSLVAPLLGD